MTENILISCDPSLLDLNAICEFLAQAYWAKDRSRESIIRSIEGSLCFGVYLDGRQVGFARVISDYATFAWLCDVFIHPDYRSQGLGKHLMEVIMADPKLQSLRWLLATRDAHTLYARYGFTALRAPDRWMEKVNSNG